MKLQRIYNDRFGHIILEYDKENMLSILFAYGSYTENYRFDMELLKKDITQLFNSPVDSTTVEIKGMGEKIENILKQYQDYWDGSLLTYFPVELLIEVLIKIKEN